MGGSGRGRTTEFRDEEGIRETGQGRRLVDGFRKLSLDFRRGESKARIGLMMNDGHADWAVGVLVAVIVVMERFSKKGKEEEKDKNE